MSFSQIKGQDRSVERIKGYLSQGNLAGAYLFSGPDGLGKKLVAETLAKAVNCQEENFDACDKCPSCLKIGKQQHPDVHFIDGSAGEIKIDQIRQLKKEVNLKAYEGKKKVFLINDAHQLNDESSNALLKTLEEPVGNSLIILITAKPHLLFKTILSRCQVIKFYPLPRQELEKVLKQEYGLHNYLAHFLAFFCEGSLGRALRSKETDILREKNRVIDDFALRKNTYLEYQPKAARQILRSHLNIMASWLRDIYLLKTGTCVEELINLDRRQDLSQAVNRYSFGEIYEILNFVSDSFFYLEHNANVKLLTSNLKAQLWKG